MTRTGVHETNNVMNNPSSTPINKQCSHFSLQHNCFNNSYRSYNKDRDCDNFSNKFIDDIKWHNNNNNNNNNNYIKKRNESVCGSLKGNPMQHQHSPFPLGTLTFCTPPDRYLSNSCVKLFEVQKVPSNLINGSKYDQLSCSMWEKFLTHRQSEEIYRKKISLWRSLFLHIKSHYPRYGLYLVGSTLTGFGSKESDVDICLIVRHSEIDQRRVALSFLTDMLRLLRRTNFISKSELIQAKVPILKFSDHSRGLEVDLNCNNSVGIRNTHLLFCYSQLDWRVRPLVILVKLWAHFHNINDAKQMTISSYSLTLMVIHFLQYGVKPVVLPCLHSEFPDKFSSHRDIHKIDILEELDPYFSLNKMSIGELLVHFFTYYSTSFNFYKNAISVRMGSVVPVEACRQVRTMKNDPHQWKFLCIEEPFDLTNTARSVYDRVTFERILVIFRRTYFNLREHLHLDSIFKPIPPSV